MREIRSKPLERENVYALQVYGSACMDEEIKVD